MKENPPSFLQRLSPEEVNEIVDRMGSLCAYAHNLELTTAVALELLEWFLCTGIPMVNPHATWLIDRAIGRHNVEGVVAKHDGWTLRDLECGCKNHAPFVIINSAEIRRNQPKAIIVVNTVDRRLN